MNRTIVKIASIVCYFLFLAISFMFGFSPGEKIGHNFDQNHFSKLIAKKSKIQVINVSNQKELKNYFKKNLLEDEMIICMGAGGISNWIREIGSELKWN